MFRSLESIRADTHQQQHTHPTLTSMSSSTQHPNRTSFPSYLLPSLPFFSRRNSGKTQTPAIKPVNLETAPAPKLSTPNFIRGSYGISGEENGTILSPLTMSPESQPIPLLSRSLAGEISADPLSLGLNTLITSTHTRRMGIAGPSYSEPPRTPTDTQSFPFPSSSSTQTSSSTASPFSVAYGHSPSSSVGTSPPSTLSSNISRSSEDTYPKLGSAVLMGSPLLPNPISNSENPLDLEALKACLPSQLPSSYFRGLARRSPTLRCAGCSTDVAFASQIISKGFTGRHGRAYLLSPMPPKAKDGKGGGVGVGAENCATTNSPQVPQTARFNLLDPFGSFSSSISSTTEEEDNPYTSAKYNLLNITTHAPSRRQLVTGLHVVADISCKVCEKVLGWKYVDASESSQRYKIGKFILETKRVVSHQGWEDREDVLWGMDMYAGLPLEENTDSFASESTPRIYEFGADEWPRRASQALSRKGKEKEKTAPQDIVNGRHFERKELGKGYDSHGDVEFDSSDEEECEEIFAGTWDRDVVRRRRDRKQELERKKKAV